MSEGGGGGGETGENLANHPNWNAILQWSLRHQDEHRSAEPLQPMDQERREFLERVLGDMASANPAREMGKRVELLRREETSREECIAALEELAYSADDLDEANDLYLMGGLHVCSAYVKNPDPELQGLACEVIAAAVQNNEKIVNFATETFVLGDLLKLVDDSDSMNVRIKALLAVSCLVRGNRTALSKFNELEGYNVLLRVVQSDHPKLRCKAVFLVSSLCTDDSSQCELYHSMGLIDQLFAYLYRSEEVDTTLLYSLRTITTISEHCTVSFPTPSGEILKNLLKQLDPHDHEEERGLCENLLRKTRKSSDTVER